jgi:hypothetical protein
VLEHGKVFMIMGEVGASAGGWDHPEVPAAAHMVAEVTTRIVPVRRWPRRLTDRLGERDQVIGGGRRGFELSVMTDQVPAARRRQASCVLLAQVVRVGLSERGQRTDHRRRIGVDIGQRRDGLPGAAIAGASPW